MNPHLTDATLNEYLDRALPGAARASADAHLAVCAECHWRLGLLQALASRLEVLPERPLQRDLQSSIMAAVRARRPAPVAPRVDPRRPAVLLIFAGQMAAALALLAFAWPFVAGRLAIPATPALDARALAGQLVTGWPDPAGLWLSLQAWLAPLAVWPSGAPAAWLSPVVAGLVLLAAGAGWLVGNSLLLRPRPAPRLRRHS